MRILYDIAGFYRPAGMERLLEDKTNWLVTHGHEGLIKLMNDENLRESMG